MLFIYNFKDNLICKTSSAEMWVLISKHHLLCLWLMDCYESELINLLGLIEYWPGKRKKYLYGCYVTAGDCWALCLVRGSGREQ